MLKHIIIPFFLITMIVWWCEQINAQSVEVHAVVTLYDGQERQYYLTEDDQLSFEGQEILLISTQGSTVQINIDDIQKIEFLDVLENQEISASAPFFYPNPVSKTATLGNIGNNQPIQILTIEGRHIKEFVANPNERVDLSQLSPGMYILRIDDHNFKLVKQ